MKSLPKKSLAHLALAGLLIAAAESASASVIITGVASPGFVSQMPGSATDYELFGSASSLTNFSVTSYTNPIYTYSYPSGTPTNTSIITPGVGGSSVSTGAVWQYTTSQVFSFTLGNSMTYDYSDFYVNVLYGNVNYNDSSTHNNYSVPFSFDDASLGLAAGPNDGGGTFVTVSDTNTSPSMGAIVQYHITGAAAGQTFTFGGVSATNSDEIDFGGISFQQTASSVPEPNTATMLVLGLGLVVVCIRRRLA